jgi:DNA-binding CsgD family transcriptional regulator
MAALARLRPLLDEVTTYEELGQQVIARLAVLFGCRGWSIMRSRAQGELDIVGTNIGAALADYRGTWFQHDPIHLAIRRISDPVVAFSRTSDWSAISRHTIYAEFAPSHDVQHFLAMHIGDSRYLTAGASSLHLYRAPDTRDFAGEELFALAQLLPAVRVAARRCARAADAHARVPLLELLLEESAPGARLILDRQGRPVWASSEARRLLGPWLGRGRALPDALVAAASGAPAARATRADGFVADGGVRVVARVHALASGPAVGMTAVELRVDDDSALRDLRRRYRLTAAETEVLIDLSEGRSNAEIAQRRGVGVATVRTQVLHILEKVGVHTRLEAALVALRALGR